MMKTHYSLAQCNLKKDPDNPFIIRNRILSNNRLRSKDILRVELHDDPLGKQWKDMTCLYYAHATDHFAKNEHVHYRCRSCLMDKPPHDLYDVSIPHIFRKFALLFNGVQQMVCSDCLAKTFSQFTLACCKCTPYIITKPKSEESMGEVIRKSIDYYQSFDCQCSNAIACTYCAIIANLKGNYCFPCFLKSK